MAGVSDVREAAVVIIVESSVRDMHQCFAVRQSCVAAQFIVQRLQGSDGEIAATSDKIWIDAVFCAVSTPCDVDMALDGIIDV